VTRALAGLLAVVALATPLAGEQAASATFTDVTQQAGVSFRHTNGAFGKKYLPETMGSGGAFLDFDEDGWQDIFLVNSTSWPGQNASGRPSALYRNNHNGTFTDVTARVGLGAVFYGMGVTAADYDNDGWTDILVTGLGQSRLYKNQRGERFADVTTAAGLTDPGFATSAMWFDADADGYLDVFVAHYVEWSIEKDLFCTLDGRTKSYCTPESYKGQSGRLMRNRGNGTFEDITARAGLQDGTAKALGVALLDYNSDGRMDIFVANDKQPNRLYENRGKTTFADVAVSAGVAFNEAGVARAGMGVDAADFDGSGRPSVVIGNFSNEMLALYTNDGKGLFIDESPASTLGPATLLSLTFGCFFFDYDLDGRLDIFTANGHVADDIGRIQPKVGYAQAPHLFRNLGGRKFTSVTANVPALQQKLVGRGAAYGDFDNDGDLDVLITENNGPAHLLRNDATTTAKWIRLKLIGGPANRSAIGSTIALTAASGERQVRLVKTGSSYLSQSELPVTFGLGTSGNAAEIRVTWPDGATEAVKPAGSNRLFVIQQGKGLLPQ
jgi:hypothetical protein